jgi:hypothetical protein
MAEVDIQNTALFNNPNSQNGRQLVVQSTKDGKSQKKSVKIGPMNSVFMFSQKTKNVAKKFDRKLRSAPTGLPESWVNFLPADQWPFNLATKPGRQNMCGCCYAFAIADSMNDAFVFGKGLPFNPQISPLAIMTCLTTNSSLKCAGGDILHVLANLSGDSEYLTTPAPGSLCESKLVPADNSIGGVTTSNCLDYNIFCDSTSLCYGTDEEKKARASIPPGGYPVDILKTRPGAATEVVDSSSDMMILKTDPQAIQYPPCRCCENSTCSGDSMPTYWKYYVKCDSIYVLTTTDVKNPDIPGDPDAIAYAKQHLMKFGAVVTGMVVRNNFISGDFSSTRNIYFEDQKYQTKAGDDPVGIAGCHALSIVGWGVEKNDITLVNYSNNTTRVVKAGTTGTPYWVVRNSWGPEWGLNGYFKIAMYQPADQNRNGGVEVNPTTALEQSHKVPTTDKDGKPVVLETIAMIIFEPGLFFQFKGSKSAEGACLSSSADTCNVPNPSTAPRMTRGPVVSSTTSPTSLPTSAPTSLPTSLPTSGPTSPPVVTTHPVVYPSPTTSPPPSQPSSQSFSKPFYNQIWFIVLMIVLVVVVLVLGIGVPMYRAWKARQNKPSAIANISPPLQSYVSAPQGAAPANTLLSPPLNLPANMSQYD